MSKRMNYLVAGYGLPAELGVVYLLSIGVKEECIRVLTHESDDRNCGFISFLKLRNIGYLISDPKDEATRDWVTCFSPDYIISLHYRKLIPKDILSVATKGCMNLHPSLLPHYRGANSVPWTIINGESFTGYTFHLMEDKFDTGNILLQGVIEISKTETAFSLFYKQIFIAMQNFPKALNLLMDGYLGIPQPEDGSYYTRALPYDGVIDPSWSLQRVDKFIRAMYFPPFPLAKLNINRQTFYLDSVRKYIELSAEFNFRKNDN